MPDGKTVSLSFRVSPRFKRLLEAAAGHERRSLTNMLEALLFAYCDEHGIQAVDDPEPKSKPKGRAKK
jgi:hypothetical protein